MSLTIRPVLCNAGIMDNYAYLITDDKTAVSAIVDAAEEKTILDACEALQIKPDYILTTHHHPDHTNANLALKKKFGLKIVGSEIERNNIPGIDICLNDGDLFQLGDTQAHIILTPGHTHGHILWHFAEDKALFTGDMLFNLCIGGLFEGTPQQMWRSIEKIKALPDDTRFYPGHEYTQASLSLLLQNQEKSAEQQYLNFIAQKKQAGLPMVGNLLGLEKQCNPYFQYSSENDFVKQFGG